MLLSISDADLRDKIGNFKII